MDRDVNIGAVNQDGVWVVSVDSLPGVKVINAANNIHKPQVQCLPGVATQLIAAAERKSVRLNIRSDQFGGVSMGGDNTITDTSGGFLDVGMVDYVETKGSLWAFNNGASSVMVDVLELI